MAIRVLVLDEDARFRRSLEVELRRLGYEPASFAHWSEALDYVERAPELDSVVTELALGEGPNGVSFAHMALSRRPDLNFAFVTREEALAAHVDPQLGPVFLKGDGPERIARAILESGPAEG
jgi:DNA-binding NtrC family response regulator